MLPDPWEVLEHTRFYQDIEICTASTRTILHHDLRRGFQFRSAHQLVDYSLLIWGRRKMPTHIHVQQWITKRPTSDWGPELRHQIR